MGRCFRSFDREPDRPVYALLIVHTRQYINTVGPLAQLVEQLTLNQRAVGSTPTRPTTFADLETTPQNSNSTGTVWEPCGQLFLADDVL